MVQFFVTQSLTLGQACIQKVHAIAQYGECTFKFNDWLATISVKISFSRETEKMTAQDWL